MTAPVEDPISSDPARASVPASVSALASQLASQSVSASAAAPGNGSTASLDTAVDDPQPSDILHHQQKEHTLRPGRSNSTTPRASLPTTAPRTRSRSNSSKFATRLKGFFGSSASTLAGGGGASDKEKDEYSSPDRKSPPLAASGGTRSASRASSSTPPSTPGAVEYGAVPGGASYHVSTGSLSESPSAVSLERRTSGSHSTHSPRFCLSEDGKTHFHHLKTAKRQERLTDMLKELVGGKKLRDEAMSAVNAILNPSLNGNPSNAVASGGGGNPGASNPAPGAPTNGASAQPPSLMSAFVHQVKTGQVDVGNQAQAQAHGQGQGHGPGHQLSFVEKYGKCHEVIGKGSFGVVRVAHKTDPTSHRESLFAVKEFKRRPQEDMQRYSKRLTSEFCISSSLHHPNIIETLDLLQDAKGEFCEVMEYCCGGDLYSLILVNEKLEYMEADCFFRQILRGVNYMHEMGVTHRDLKPENILLTANGAVKITDFGNGECFRMAWEKEIHLSTGVCGSAPYIAPEEFTEAEFDPRPVDIWAIGVIYMAMRTGRHLWRMAQPDDEFYAKYLDGRRDENGYEPIESLKRARCRNVIYSILDPVPGRRITGKQILQSEWGREIHICEAGERGY